MTLRFALFGQDGAFSTTVLRGLARAGRAPALVIQSAQSGFSLTRGGVRIPWRRPTDRLAAEARRLGIPRASVAALDDPALAALLARRALETFVIAGFDRLLPAGLLARFPRPGLNVHPGRLPEARGPSPLFWSLRRGDPELHYAIHVVDAGEDTGPIAAAGSLSPRLGAPVAEHYRALAEAALPALVRALGDHARGRLVTTPQPGAGGRAPRPTLADHRIDPEQSAAVAFGFAAAYAPAHPIHAECAGDRFYVARAVDYDLERALGFDFVLIGDRLLLRCRPGTLELELSGAEFSADYAE